MKGLAYNIQVEIKDFQVKQCFSKLEKENHKKISLLLIIR